MLDSLLRSRPQMLAILGTAALGSSHRDGGAVVGRISHPTVPQNSSRAIRQSRGQRLARRVNGLRLSFSALALASASCAASTENLSPSTCGWVQASVLHSQSEPELNAALERHAPETALAWGAAPLVWVAPELSGNFDRAFAEDAISAAGFSHLELMTERDHANFKIWPFFSEGDRLRSVGDNVLCGVACIQEYFGGNPRYFVGYWISPLQISMAAENWGNPMTFPPPRGLGSIHLIEVNSTTYQGTAQTWMAWSSSTAHSELPRLSASSILTFRGPNNAC